ncbi:hypothetical protein BN903_6 [Halorubrum sp. AJ67]|nr:hypothetical protein BN903_6 [Halorubrum sp. AJ67]
MVRDAFGVSSSRKALCAFRTTASVCPPRDWGFGGLRCEAILDKNSQV